MRIHTNSHGTIQIGAMKAGVTLENLTEHGSRKSTRAFEVHLLGTSNHWAGHSGATGYAATWDQWGVFLAYVFAEDPAASCPYYASAEDFHFQTDGRFLNGWPPDAHAQHHWDMRESDGQVYRQHCKDCSAVRQVRIVERAA